MFLSFISLLPEKPNNLYLLWRLFIPGICDEFLDF